VARSQANGGSENRPISRRAGTSHRSAAGAGAGARRGNDDRRDRRSVAPRDAQRRGRGAHLSTQAALLAGRSPIVPLNREAGSKLREAFSQRVFDSSSAALAEYWNEQYFLGMFPPATLSSTLAVKRYVAVEPNAIGYVESAAVDGTVRVALELTPASR